MDEAKEGKKRRGDERRSGEWIRKKRITAKTVIAPN